MAGALPLGPGYRFAIVTPEDRSGIVYVVAFLGFTYSSLTFITRCLIKWRVVGLEDFAMLLAQIASLVQFTLILMSLSAGLAKKFDLLSNDEYAQMVSTQYGNQIALYISLGFSKLATILLTRNLFIRDMTKAWIICNIVIGPVAVWTMLAPFLVSVGCSPASLAPMIPSEACPSIVARYKVVVITDAITDMILVITPVYLCWQLQMSVKLKLQVLAVFSFRLPLIGLAGYFLETWIHSLNSTNPGIRRTAPIVYQQIELYASLMAATIPCLKNFIRSFDTGSGLKANLGSSGDDYLTTSRANHTESYKMSSMNRSQTGTLRVRMKGDSGEVRVNPKPCATGRDDQEARRVKSFKDDLERHAKPPADRASLGSSHGLVITREMQWEVTSERARRGSDTDTPGILRLPQ